MQPLEQLPRLAAWFPLQMWPGGWHDGNAWVGILMMVVWALLLAVVVLVVVRVLLLPVLERTEPSTGDAGADQSGADESAMEILRERFARGEIDEEEFERRAEVLRER